MLFGKRSLSNLRWALQEAERELLGTGSANTLVSEYGWKVAKDDRFTHMIMKKVGTDDDTHVVIALHYDGEVVIYLDEPPS